MDKQTRILIYAFLSRLFATEIDAKSLRDLRANTPLLELLGSECKNWLSLKSDEEILEELAVDFSTLFLMNAVPIESAVLDAKNEVLVGLENPVMNFYFTNGYEINLNITKIVAPDHLAIELGFAQNLVAKDDYATLQKFFEKHLMAWVPPYLIGVKHAAMTPFYRAVCDFGAEFLVADYGYVTSMGLNLDGR